MINHLHKFRIELLLLFLNIADMFTWFIERMLTIRAIACIVSMMDPKLVWRSRNEVNNIGLITWLAHSWLWVKNVKVNLGSIIKRFEVLTPSINILYHSNEFCREYISNRTVSTGLVPMDFNLANLHKLCPWLATYLPITPCQTLYFTFFFVNLIIYLKTIQMSNI